MTEENEAIENLIKKLNLIEICYEQNGYSVGNSDTINEAKNLIEKQQKENKSLQKAYDNCYCEYKHYKQYESISKDFINEKIKHNNKLIDNTNDMTILQELNFENQVLIKLLKEGEENERS